MGILVPFLGMSSNLAGVRSYLRWIANSQIVGREIAGLCDQPGNERIGGTHADYVTALKLTEKTRQDGSTHSPMRCFSFFFAFFAAFFSLAVMAGCFLVSLLLFCCLPMVLAFALN